MGRFALPSPLASATRFSPLRMATVAHLLALFVLVAGAALASQAHADEIDGLRDLNLQVYGRLDQHCILGSISNADFGDLTRPGMRADSHLALDCNVPINVKISAANGALANSRHPEGQGPFAGSVDYNVEVQLPIRRPAHDVMVKHFESRDLAGAGQTFNTGEAIAVDGMNLRVALEPVTSTAGLLAGHYSETIEITVTPS